MKQLIYILVALMAIGMVSAVTVDCGVNKWYDWDAGDCKAYELQPVFDEVTDDITQNTNDIGNVGAFMYQSDARWSQDSSGTSMSSVQRFLNGDFMDFLRGIFVTREEFNAVEDRTYELEALLYFYKWTDTNPTEHELLSFGAQLKMEDKFSDTVDYKGYSCSRNLHQNTGSITCMRSIN